MTLEQQILAAVALDLVLGDPRWLPHPVRGIAALAARLESLSSRRGRLAGVLVAATVYFVVGAVVWGAIRAAALASSAAADAVSIIAIYTSLAARDLARHSMAVFRPLAAGDLAEARRRAACIVGRDTAELDESGVVRAAVESVAESTVDGVAAPLFYALVAGPVGAMVYRAINTLDSMFGHRDARYARFGWAPARCDDLANFLPARLTAPLLCLAAAILRQRPLQAVRILLRDGRKHASPNAGLPEAAVAGALGVQLGGPVSYDGVPMDRPTLGDPLLPLAPRHIVLANALMWTSAAIFLAAGLSLRLGTAHLWHLWRAAA